MAPNAIGAKVLQVYDIVTCTHRQICETLLEGGIGDLREEGKKLWINPLGGEDIKFIHKL